MSEPPRLRGQALGPHAAREPVDNSLARTLISSNILGGRPMVGLQTLDLAIGVRVPASQPIRHNKLRAAYRLPVLAFYHYCVTSFCCRCRCIKVEYYVNSNIRI